MEKFFEQISVFILAVPVVVGFIWAAWISFRSDEPKDQPLGWHKKPKR